MQLIRKISFVSAFVLIAMMLCPAFAMAQKAQLKSESHCHSESPVEEEQILQCCCDQSAILVQELHAPFETTLLELLPAGRSGTALVFVFDIEHLPYLKTRDHLATLSTLRL